jgi:hypothetical protein
MNYLVVLIVEDVDQGAEILEAWEQAGVLGVTILESTGLGRVRRAGLLDDLPLMPSLSNLFQNEEIRNRTFFSVVDSQDQVDKMVAAAGRIIGNLDDPHTGFLFVVPVLQVYGLGKHRTSRHLE